MLVMKSKVYIAAAGSGKTTFIIDQTIDLHRKGLPANKKILIVTFTTNNQNNIRSRIMSNFGYIPSNIVIIGWFSFLLEYWIRPFKGTVLTQLYNRHVGLAHVDGISGMKKLKSGKFIMTYRNDTEKFLDKKQDNLYSDKLAEFAYKCWENNKKDLEERFSNIVDTLFVDEVQDLAAWDYELIKVLFKTNAVKCILCGDPRQHTYSTTKAPKNKKYEGNIVSYIDNKVNNKKTTYVDIDVTTLSKSHRCGKDICSFASSLMPEHPATEMCSCSSCSEKRGKYTLQQGMFLVRRRDVKAYVERYNPLTLVWNKTTKVIVDTGGIMNWGESKGLQAEATLIYLPNTLINYYSDSREEQPSKHVLSRFYVAVTRAMYTAALVVPDDFNNTFLNLPFWND